MHASNSIIKFADDTTVVGLITNNDETAYREEVRALGVWYQENNLTLNVNKTKEMIVDFRKQQREQPPIYIDGTVVERVESFKFLGGQTEMVHPHRQCGEEGAAAPLQPQETEKIWLVTKNTHKLLQMQNQEHPVGLYHRLVRQLLRP